MKKMVFLIGIPLGIIGGIDVYHKIQFERDVEECAKSGDYTKCYECIERLSLERCRQD